MRPVKFSGAALNSMYNALGGARWLNRGDYVLQGHTSSFYKNAPTGVGDFLDLVLAARSEPPSGSSLNRICPRTDYRDWRCRART